MNDKWIELDVRPILASGREPLALIMNYLDTLEDGQCLRLKAPFYPKPLVDMLTGQGWQIQSQALENDDDWELLIHRSEHAS